MDLNGTLCKGTIPREFLEIKIKRYANNFKRRNCNQKEVLLN